MVIAAYGFMLGKPAQDAPLVATKIAPFEQDAPTAYRYDTQNPLYERAQPYDDLTLGFGLKTQRGFNDRKYAFASNVDASIGGLLLKGPALTQLTPATTDAINGVVRFFELGGSLFAAVGQYILKRVSDASWTVALDYATKLVGGSPPAAVDAVTLAFNGLTAVAGISNQPSPTTTFAFVAFGDAFPMAWSTDGTTWTVTWPTQVLTVPANASGTFTITYNGVASTALNWNCTAADVQTALRTIPALAWTTVTGTAPTFTVTFQIGEPFVLALGTNTLASPPSVALGVAGLAARALALNGTEFWRARDVNMAAKVDRNADPSVAANWGNPNAFRVGDKSSPITGLAAGLTGAMVFFKTDGIYTVDEAGLDHKMAPFIGSSAADAENGKYVGAFGNDLYVSYNKQQLRVVPRATSFGTLIIHVEDIGPERITENDSIVKGRITAFMGHGAIGAYAAIYDDDGGSSRLLKFSSWLTPEVIDGQLDESKRIDAWHGGISAEGGVLAGVKVQTLYRSAIGAPAGHYRCYLGLSNGSIVWFVLPCVPNPAGCTSYVFNTADAGTITFPLWHGTFQADKKTLRAMSVTGPKIDNANTASGSYALDASGTFTPFATFNVGPWQKVQAANPMTLSLGQFRLTLTGAPQVAAFVIHHNVVPQLLLLRKFAVLAADGLTRRDGSPYRLGASTVRSAIKALADSGSAATIIWPDEASEQATVTNYGELMTWDERARRWQAGLQVETVQFAVNTIYGTVGRLRAYTIGDLKAFTILQLGGL